MVSLNSRVNESPPLSNEKHIIASPFNINTEIPELYPTYFFQKLRIRGKQVV
jgi:hypothetical protein